MKCCLDTDCNEPMMKKGFTALKNGTWEEFLETLTKKMKASEWGLDRIKEAFELVAQDEAKKMSIVQEIMLRSTDYLRRIIAPVEDKEESQCRTCARTATVSLWKTTFRRSLGENPQSGGAQLVEKSTIGSNRAGFWPYKQGTVLSRQRSAKRMRYLEACAQI